MSTVHLWAILELRCPLTPYLILKAASHFDDKPAILGPTDRGDGGDGEKGKGLGSLKTLYYPRSSQEQRGI